MDSKDKFSHPHLVKPYIFQSLQAGKTFEPLEYLPDTDITVSLGVLAMAH